MNRVIAASLSLALIASPALAQRGSHATGGHSAPAFHSAAPAFQGARPAFHGPAPMVTRPQFFSGARVGVPAAGFRHPMGNGVTVIVGGHPFHHHPHSFFVYPYLYAAYSPFYAYPYYPYYGYGFYDSYSSSSYDYSAPIQAYQAQQQALNAQVSDLSAEVQQLQADNAELRGELTQPPLAPPPAAAQPQAAPSTSAAAPATVLIFRDGRRVEVRNYAIVGESLWILSDQRAMKVPLSQLDIPATVKENEQRGTPFTPPPQEKQ